MNRKLKWLAGAVAALVVVAAVAFYVRPVTFFQHYTEIRMALSGVESHSVIVAGHRIHYYYYAEGPSAGPVMVLIHGLGGRSEDWRNLAPYFARAGYRVYLPDLPGYGRSQKPRDFSYSVHDEAAAVVGFFDALGLQQVDLGGWSMGGWIVQLIAAGHPERVRRLILFDSAGIYEMPSWDTSLFTPQTPEQLDELDALLQPHPPSVPGFVARDILRISAKNAWVIHRALAAMLTAEDVTDNLLPHLKMPVLIVWGAEDRITPVDQAEKIHALVPQSQLDVIPNCGHLAPNQCAAQIGPKAVAFLSK